MYTRIPFRRWRLNIEKLDSPFRNHKRLKHINSSKSPNAVSVTCGVVEPFPFLALSHRSVSDVTWGPVLSLTPDGSTRLHHGNRALYQVVCDLSGHFTVLVIYCHFITILNHCERHYYATP